MKNVCWHFCITRSLFLSLGAGVITLAATASAQSPSVISLKTNRLLTWTPGTYTNKIVVVQRATNLVSPVWTPFAYDTALYSRTSLYPYPYYSNIALPLPRTTVLPSSSGSSAFYRLAIPTNIVDTNLILPLTFDDDFVGHRRALDISGRANHGLAYGRPGYPTNWPTTTMGPDGSQAAEFRPYFDGWGAYGSSGDYVGIPTIDDFTNLPKATITFWCHYYTFINNQCDCNA